MDIPNVVRRLSMLGLAGVLAGTGYVIYDLIAVQTGFKDASIDSVVALLRDPASRDATIAQFGKNKRTGMTLSQLWQIEYDCNKSVGRPCGNGYIDYTIKAIKKNSIEVAVGTVVTNEADKVFSFVDTSRNGCTYLGTMSTRAQDLFSTVLVDKKACVTPDGAQLIENVDYAIPLTKFTPIDSGTKLKMYRTVVMPFLGRMLDPSYTADQLVKAIEDCKSDPACAEALPK